MQDTRKTSERQVMIYITTSDYHRLSGLIEMSRERNGDADREYLDQLEEELGRAELVNPKENPCGRDYHALEGEPEGSQKRSDRNVFPGLSL